MSQSRLVMRRWRSVLLVGLVVFAALLVVGWVSGWRSDLFLGSLAVTLFVALLLATVLMFPSFVATLDQGGASPPADLVKARNDVRTALLQGFASILLLAGAYVAFTQLRTSQRELQTTGEGQQTERFSRAVEQLAATTGPAVRLGGIFTLVELADQKPRQRVVVARILAAYVQHNAPRPDSPPPETDDPPTPLTLTQPDVQASLDFLATQPIDENLLAGLLLDRVALPGVTFAEGTAWLEGARLREADLSGASIVGGRLARAELIRATLSRADLRNTDLTEARLTGAHMMDSDLSGATLDGAELTGADLHGANLAGVSLRNAVLVGADLSAAKHVDGDLAGADLRHADLRAADLRLADNLLEADLTGAQCDPDRTLLPTTVACDGGLLFVKR